MIGLFFSRASSIARVMTSPTTAPMLPPMKLYSIALMMTSRPFNLPRALMTASVSPVSSCAFFSRSEYGFRSTNFSGSVEARLSLKVSYSPSSNRFASRVRASMRKCLPHFGQTFWFSSRSFFQMIWRQLSHFTHNPSVRIFFSPEASRSPDCRLNQAIRIWPSGDQAI